jgi:hypothetical protein
MRHLVWKFTGDIISPVLKKNPVISSATRIYEIPIAESQKLTKPESLWTRGLLSQPHRWFALIGHPLITTNYHKRKFK